MVESEELSAAFDPRGRNAAVSRHVLRGVVSLARLQDLSPEQARAVSALLDEALSVEHAERPRWRSELSRREPEWSTLINRLLDEMPGTSAGTQDSIARVVSNVARQDGLCQGQEFGAYRLQRMLGQGGMGSVWLAERADGLFQRSVALKLPHRNLVDTAARERFARERDILARLTHPLIARLLDAGVSPDGHPYLALEYVEGQTLSAHCDERRLGLRARLELVLQVLSAVQYAHQNLVIHRDIKPGNILVTAQGQVRLLDFGISKLMAEGATGEVYDSELTQLAGRALTPDYASPEQIAGKPVSTASDVYSLGVVLYALLCGRRPFTTHNGQRSYAAQGGEVLRPSQQALSVEIALARASTPKKLARALSGDLDTIVQKALKQDPGERYPTAEAFREDIARYLAGEPVKARKDSLVYRGWKFVRRQRVAVSVSAVVATLLLAATRFSLDQASQARAAAALATQQAERARAVQGFLLGVFTSNSDQQLDPLAARRRTARELLDIGSQRVVSQLSGTPEVLAELCETLADMYHQMGLGSDAARMRAQRIAALQKVYGKDHELIAEAWLLKAQDQRQAAELMPALQSVAAARQMLERLGDRGSQTRAFVWLEAAQLEQYTALDQLRDDAERARAYFKDHIVERMWSNRFQSVNISARAYQLAGDFERAESTFVDALRELEVLGLQGTAWSVNPLVWLAETQWQASEFDAAESNLRQALSLSLFYNGPDNGATVQTQTKLAALLHQTGRREEGLRLLRDLEPRLGAAGTHALATWRSFYGSVLLAEGRVEEAHQLFDQLVIELSARLPKSLLMARALLLRSGAALRLGRFAQSADDSAVALQLWAAGAGTRANPHTFTAFYLARARAQLAQADVVAAKQSLGGLAVQPDPATAETIESLLVQAQAELSSGQCPEARSTSQRALAMLRTPRFFGKLPQLEADARQVAGSFEKSVCAPK